MIKKLLQNMYLGQYDPFTIFVIVFYFIFIIIKNVP